MTLPAYLFTTLSSVELVLAVTLLFISGVAWCFNCWILPIIKFNNTLSAIDQFSEVPRRGALWLDPVNAAFAIYLALAALLQTQHAESGEAARWKALAVASFTLFQVAWWERVTIFWLDEAAVALKKKRKSLTEEGDEIMSESMREELHRILDQWALRHAVRATLPFVAALMLLMPRAK